MIWGKSPPNPVPQNGTPKPSCPADEGPQNPPPPNFNQNPKTPQLMGKWVKVPPNLPIFEGAGPKISQFQGFYKPSQFGEGVGEVPNPPNLQFWAPSNPQTSQFQGEPQTPKISKICGNLTIPGRHPNPPPKIPNFENWAWIKLLIFRGRNLQTLQPHNSREGGDPKISDFEHKPWQKRGRGAPKSHFLGGLGVAHGPGGGGGGPAGPLAAFLAIEDVGDVVFLHLGAGQVDPGATLAALDHGPASKRFLAVAGDQIPRIVP